ncbi:MAG: NADH-ubiquinone oxidoreductase-F iron-sulfur binding region domain-containing protein [Cyanobacteriota bacterium]
MERTVLLSKDYKTGDALGKVLSLQPNQVIEMVKDSGLRGRGGAGFPTGLKWDLAAKASGEKKYVICNADEGEPGTFKDRVLLLEHTEKLVEGMAIAAYAIGSDEGIIYLRSEYRWMLKELQQRIESSMNVVKQKGFTFRLEVRQNAGAYICGEETALIESLEGKRGEPRNRPPYPVECGYLNCPTIVNNVETFCYIPKIVNQGPDEFKRYGTEKSKGTKLFSISGDCNKPGVYELDLGSPVSDVLKLVDAERTKAVQIGGASGVTIGEKDFDKPIAFEGFPPGGSIIIFNKSRNMRHVLKNLMEFFVDESCGQCTPCREGNLRILEAIDRLDSGEKLDEEYMETLVELANVMKVASKCGLGQTSANPFLYIYENFREDL